MIVRSNCLAFLTLAPEMCLDLIPQKGGIAAIVYSMKTNIEEKAVQKAGIAVLDQLATVGTP